MMLSTSRVTKKISRNINLSFLMSILLVACSSVAFASGSNTTSISNGHYLGGLGSSAPAKKNISKSAKYKAFRWSVGDTNFVQVNDLQGKVLAVFAINKNSAERLGIGSAPSGAVNSPHASGAHCPCSSEEVASGPGYVVIVVTGSNGEIIAVKTIHYPTSAK